MLILVLFNTIGCYLVFYGDLLEVRHEALVVILGHEALGDRMVSLAFPLRDGRPAAADLTFTDDDEFMYQGRMYDVVSSMQHDGRIVYKCYTDDKETALNQNLCNKIDADREAPAQNRRNNSILKEHVTDYIPHSHLLSCIVPVTSLSYTHITCTMLRSYVYRPVVSPPPEFFIS